MNKKIKELISTAQHTPVPWYADNLDIRADDGSGIGIACVAYGANRALRLQAKADAAHIVKCVNHFDELLRVLEMSLSISGATHEDQQKYFTKATVLLAKVQS